MPRPVTPTDPEEERAKGRVALWLDPDDMLWLAKHLASAHASDAETNTRIGRIRFRILAALHKAGLPNNPWASEDGEA